MVSGQSGTVSVDNKGQAVDNKGRLAAGARSGPGTGPRAALGSGPDSRGRARPLTVPYCPLTIPHCPLIVA